MKKKSLGKSLFKAPSSASANRKIGPSSVGSSARIGRDINPRFQVPRAKVQTINATRLERLIARRDYSGMLRIVTPDLFRRGLKDASTRKLLLQIEMELCREGERLVRKGDLRKAMKLLERVVRLGGRLRSRARSLMQISSAQRALKEIKGDERAARRGSPPRASKAPARRKGTTPQPTPRPASVANEAGRPEIDLEFSRPDSSDYLRAVDDAVITAEEPGEQERRTVEEKQRQEVVRRTPHMDLSPEAPLEPASSFEVWISVDTSPPKPGEATEEIELTGGPSQEEFPVKVTLIVSGHFELLEDSIKQMMIFRSKESAPVTFKLRCAQEFPAEQAAALSALFTYEDHPSGRVTRNFRVENGKLVSVPAPQEDTTSLRRASLQPKVALAVGLDAYALTISVLDTGENDGRHFRLIADATAIAKRVEMPWNLGERTDQLVSGYMKKFVTAGLQATTRVDELKGAGLALFRATPEPFQKLFWEMIDREAPPKTIMVVSDDPYIPWELMVPRREERGQIKTRKPLGVEFCVGRWIRSDYVTAPQQISLDRTTYVVAPKYVVASKNLKWAPEEAKFICESFQPSKQIDPADLDKIKAALEGQGVTLLHFICHGAAGAGADQTVYLRDMVNNLTASGVEGSDEFVNALFHDHTFVFLNACEVGRPAPALVGINGFGPTFIRLGASGVVAALWSVKDDIAHEVAVTFYQKMLQDPQIPFAEILRGIRSKAYSSNAEDTYAAYCFYGSPLARRKALQS